MPRSQRSLSQNTGGVSSWTAFGENSAAKVEFFRVKAQNLFRVFIKHYVFVLEFATEWLLDGVDNSIC